MIPESRTLNGAVAPEVLAIADDDELAEAVAGAIYDYAWPVSRDQGIEAALSSLTEGQRAVLAISVTWLEVANGGLWQLFWNESAGLILEVPPAFRRVGAEEPAAWLERALSVFAEGRPPAATGERRAHVDSLPPESQEFLRDLERKLVDWLDADEPPRLVASYIRAHPEQFVSAT